jgi:hypothetical protein
MRGSAQDAARQLYLLKYWRDYRPFRSGGARTAPKISTELESIYGSSTAGPSLGGATTKSEA